MPRRAKGVTAAQVEKGTKPGRYGDGAGLYLLVRSKREKYWLFRFVRASTPAEKEKTGKDRKMCEMGLGPAKGRTAVSLSAARAKARELHAAVREGRNPLAEREAEESKAEADAAKVQAGAITFAQVADMFLDAHDRSWRNRKHRQQWRNTLTSYVYPSISALLVSSVDTGAVMKIIEPLWRDKTETASRVRGRIEAILDYAKARGWRDGENPARWRGHLDMLLPKRSKVQHTVHHAALPWREVGAFMQRLRCTFSVSARCLEFLILTACRSNEARGARWDEIDLDHAVWTVPAQRIKGGREHRVPLSEPAMVALHEMAQLGANGFVFPGARTGSALSGMTLSTVVRAAGVEVTVHGFRSTFRDWCAEATNFPRELAEAALAHVLEDKTEAAYQRGDLLEKRRKLMTEWAKFCATPMTKSAEVVTLHAAAG